MSDIASLLIGGGFALAGSYLGPLMQGFHKREDRRSEHRAIMRKQVEEALRLVARLRSNADRATKAVFRVAPDPEAGHEALSELNGIYAIVAVYFPDTLPIIDQWRAKTGEEIEFYTRSPEKGSRTASLEEIADKMSNAVSTLCDHLQTSLVAEAKKVVGP